MKFRTDFVTNSSSSSYTVSVMVRTTAGKNYPLDIKPVVPLDSDEEGSIFLCNDYSWIDGLSDLDDLCDGIENMVDLSGELKKALEWNRAENEFSEEEFEAVPSVKEKLKILKDVEGHRLSSIYDSYEGFRKRILYEIQSIDEIEDVVFSENHFAVGEFAPNMFLSDVETVLKYDELLKCDSVRKRWVFSFSKGIARDRTSREYLLNAISENGGEYSPRLSKRVDYLIADQCGDADIKVNKAKEQGIKVISEKEFDEMASKEEELFYVDEDAVVREMRRYFPGESDMGIRAILKYLKKEEGPCVYSGATKTVVNLKTGKLLRLVSIDNCMD